MNLDLIEKTSSRLIKIEKVMQSKIFQVNDEEKVSRVREGTENEI